jgi:acyl carrier protein
VRRGPASAIEFLGRLDQQVKIRGFRIELGEVEAALAGYPGVRESVVSAREDLPGDIRLVAYVVPQPLNGPVSEAAVLEHLTRRLPGYMVPSAVVLLDAMPLGPGGKIDRRALPPPGHSAARGETPYLAPRTPVEAQLAALWAQVLRAERVGIHDNFFQLRGHSLLAAELVSRVRDAFGVELPLRTVFLEPTVAGMATAIAQSRAEQAEREDAGRLEELLTEIDGLSDEEAQQLLSEEAQ